MADKTEAAELLGRWVDQQETKTAAARAVDVSLPTLLAYCDGSKRPKAAGAEIIEAVTGIGRALWLTTEERERVDGAVSRFRALRDEEAAQSNTPTDGDAAA